MLVHLSSLLLAAAALGVSPNQAPQQARQIVSDSAYQRLLPRGGVPGGGGLVGGEPVDLGDVRAGSGPGGGGDGYILETDGSESEPRISGEVGEPSPAARERQRRRLERMRHARGDVRSQRSSAPPPTAASDAQTFGGIAKVLLWVVLGVFLGAVLLSLLTRLRSRADAESGKGAAVSDGDADEGVLGPPPTEDEVIALARAGRFSEAIHLLLLRALARIGAARRGGLSRALTSREVLRAAGVEGEAYRSLGDLVLAVERSHFGGRLTTQADFDASHDAYRRFLAAT